MNSGVVVVGYQGVGKSTLANHDLHFIDLESSCFKNVNGDRYADWFEFYCQVAIHLASQGRVVFVSSHVAVREYLISTPLPENIHVMCLVPSEDLKYSWLERLQNRFEHSGLVKDYLAFSNARDRYTENIREIKSDFEVVLELDSLEYDLASLLQSKFDENNFGFSVMKD